MLNQLQKSWNKIDWIYHWIDLGDTLLTLYAISKFSYHEEKIILNNLSKVQNKSCKPYMCLQQTDREIQLDISMKSLWQSFKVMKKHNVNILSGLGSLDKYYIHSGILTSSQTITQTRYYTLNSFALAHNKKTKEISFNL